MAEIMAVAVVSNGRCVKHGLKQLLKKTNMLCKFTLGLRHGRLTHESIEGRMNRKPTRGRRIQMLHDLANDDGFVALKRAAEDKE